jgi:hypothetical protein
MIILNKLEAKNIVDHISFSDDNILLKKNENIDSNKFFPYYISYKYNNGDINKITISTLLSKFFGMTYNKNKYVAELDIIKKKDLSAIFLPTIEDFNMFNNIKNNIEHKLRKCINDEDIIECKFFTNGLASNRILANISKDTKIILHESKKSGGKIINLIEENPLEIIKIINKTFPNWFHYNNKEEQKVSLNCKILLDIKIVSCKWRITSGDEKNPFHDVNKYNIKLYINEIELLYNTSEENSIIDRNTIFMPLKENNSIEI